MPGPFDLVMCRGSEEFEPDKNTNSAQYLLLIHMFLFDQDGKF